MSDKSNKDIELEKLKNQLEEKRWVFAWLNENDELQMMNKDQWAEAPGTSQSESVGQRGAAARAVICKDIATSGGLVRVCF